MALDAFTLAIALTLPWVAGSLAIAALEPQSTRRPGHAAWTIGAGWFAGVLLVTAWMRALSLVGVPFGRASIAAGPVLVAVAALVWMQRHRNIEWRTVLREGLSVVSGRTLSGAARIAWYGLVAWLLLRGALLLAEVVLQPLYPWDAWIQWATKARVWYEMHRIVPFVRAEAWFTAPGLAYFDASPNYPATLPLLQVWANVMLGRWDDSLMNVPWWACGVAFVFVCYGALRRFGFGPLGALAGAWLVGSLPLANVHVALAGYADLPMAMFYTCAVLALLHWLDERRIGTAMVLVAFVAGLPTIKIPGIMWAATLVPGILVAWFRPHARALLVALGGLGLLVVLILTRTEATILGYRMHLDFAPAWAPVAESLFLLGNWHLLWYGALAMVVIGYRSILSRELLTLSAVVLAGLFCLLVVFGFTNAREWVVEQTTVNRAVLHVAPLLALWSLALFARWRRERQDAAAAAPAAPPDAAGAPG